MAEQSIACIQEIIKKLSQHEHFHEAIQICLFNSIPLKIRNDRLINLEEFSKEFGFEGVLEYLLELIGELNLWEATLVTFTINETLKDEVKALLNICKRKATILEILVEEPSMKNALEIILPQILPEGYQLGKNSFIRPHQGKSDLQKSIPKKVTAYQHFPKPVLLIVIQDQDSNDCKELKKGLIELIVNINPKQSHLVRIACKELENFYLGDMLAIEAVYPTFNAKDQQRKAKYRNPDNIFAAYDLGQQIKIFSKGYASKNIPNHMNLDRNLSPSFNQLISGVRNFLN